MPSASLARSVLKPCAPKPFAPNYNASRLTTTAKRWLKLHPISNSLKLLNTTLQCLNKLILKGNNLILLVAIVQIQVNSMKLSSGIKFTIYHFPCKISISKFCSLFFEKIFPKVGELFTALVPQKLEYWR